MNGDPVAIPRKVRRRFPPARRPDGHGRHAVVAIPRKVRHRFPPGGSRTRERPTSSVAIPRKVRRRFPLKNLFVLLGLALVSQSLVRFGADFHLDLLVRGGRISPDVAIPRKVRRRFPRPPGPAETCRKTVVAIPRKVRRRFPPSSRGGSPPGHRMSQSLVRFGADFHMEIPGALFAGELVAIPRKVRRRFPPPEEGQILIVTEDVAIPRKVRRRFPRGGARVRRGREAGRNPS